MRQPEILAPAGTYDAFIAAIHNGCNAVYLGGEKFGARAYASNFDHAALIRAVSYARLFDVKIYYAINTLIKDTEIKELIEEVNTLRTIGIDCFIIQDIGAIALLKTIFDDIELHASTQINCHSSYGADFLKDMGISRVVLARELSLAEIKLIKAKTSLEIEAFVHGALCYCYSGQCLMSSFLGGRSGNRGRCAQPCRLKYKTLIDDHVVANTHVLSPKDIETLTIIPELVDAGIDAFKIEGRMKSKEYVGLMTKLYRHYTDQYIKEGQIHITQEDIQDMTQIFNRGDFSNGYYHDHNGPSMMTIEQPKNQGLVIGKVVACKGSEITMTFFEKIVGGDCIELALTDGTYHSFITNAPIKGTKKLSISTKSPVRSGYEIRRIKSFELNERINKDSSSVSQEAIDMKVTLRIDQAIELTISNHRKRISVKGDIVQAAKNQGLSVERIEKQFLKLGDYPVFINEIETLVDDQVFVPVSQLNALRRKGLEEWFNLQWLAPELIELPNLKTSKNKQNNHKKITVLLKNRKQLDVVLGYTIDRVYLELFNFEREEINALIERCHKANVEVFLALPKIVRHENDKMLHLMAEDFKGNIDGFLIRSIDSYRYVKSYCENCKIQWDYGVSVMNSYTAQYLTSFDHICGYTPSLELNKHGIWDLPLAKAEQVVYGYMTIMTSAQCVRKNTSACVKETGKLLYLKDRKEVDVPVETVCQFCYNNIYNGIPHYLIDKIEEFQEKGLGQFRIDLLNESDQEIHKLMKAIFEDQGSKKMPVIESFTRGHYNKGVE